MSVAPFFWPSALCFTPPARHIALVGTGGAFAALMGWI